MPQPPRPCAHCGNTQIMIVPNMMVDLSVATTIFGAVAAKHVKGRYWTFSLAICTACGCTQTFTANAPQLAEWVQTQTITVPQR